VQNGTFVFLFPPLRQAANRWWQYFMKPLNYYHIIDNDLIVYKSKICSVACSLEYSQEVAINNALMNRIDELTKSYFNQWQFLISAYNKLYNLFFEHNKTNDISENIITEYNVFSIEKEKEFRDYTYLLVISLKTFLDLFACLVDITISQEIKSEDKMPSFHSFGKSKNFTNQKIAQAFENFRDKQKYPWIDLLNESRNRIIHRGYHLKPEFHLKKGNELTMIVYKGTDIL